MNNSVRSFHRRRIDNQYHVWFVDDLWKLSESLPVDEVPPEKVINLDVDGWFSKAPPTPRNILNHMKRILEADLNYPIILSPDSMIMDGAHRACKAIILNMKVVKVVRFKNLPPRRELMSLTLLNKPLGSIKLLALNYKLLKRESI